MIVNRTCIREGAIMDRPQVLELTRSMGYEVLASELESRLKGILADTNQQFFVAEDEKGVVQGWVHVCAVTRLGMETFAEIGGIVVAERHRESGIGKMLVERCQEWATEGNRDLLRVRCNTTRLDAIAFYKTLGFEHTKDQRVFDKPLSIQDS